MSNLLKKQIYAGLMEIIKDDKYYYHSRVGADYSHLTDTGKNAVIEYLEQVAPYMLRKEKQELEALAKQITWDELKK